MGFTEDVKQAWLDLDQERLTGLMRLDYEHNDEDTWSQKAIDFLSVSEEANIESIKIFRLAQKVYEHDVLIGNTRRRWLLFIMPHLLNTYAGRDFDDLGWITAATGGELPSPEWQEIQSWVADWVKSIMSVFASGSDLPEPGDAGPSGFFQPRAGEGNYRPAVFHSLVLHILQQKEVLDPTTPFAFDVAQWLFNNTLAEPVVDATVNTAFASGATVLKLSQIEEPEWANLSTEVLNTFESNSLCDENAPTSWRGQEARVQLLLDSCPFWHEPAIASELRNRSRTRLTDLAKTMGEKFNVAHDALPPSHFHTPLSDVARFPLPEYRSRDVSKTFWVDSEFTKLTKSLKEVADMESVLDKQTDDAIDQSKSTVAARLSFEETAEKPISRVALPQLSSTMNQNGALKGYATRVVLSQQIRSARMQTGAFSFEESKLSLADTDAWMQAIGASAPLANVSATLSSWVALEMWDGLRGKFMGDSLATEEQSAADALWQQVHADEFFISLDSDDLDIEQLPTVDSLRLLRQRLSMLVQVGHPQWSDLLKKLNKSLTKLESKRDSDAYHLLAAARIELSLTAISSGQAPAEALIGEETNLENLSAFKQLLDVANAALSSSLAWEARAGFNACVLLVRLAEVTGDLFTAHQLAADLSDRAVSLIETSINSILDGEPLPGSELPLAFAASDLVRYAREQGAGIVESGLLSLPAWWSGSLSKLIQDLTAKFTNDTLLKRMAHTGGLGTRLLLLAIAQIKLDQFERGRKLLVRPPKEDESDGFVSLNTLYRLHRAICVLFCPDPLLLRSVPDPPRDEPWWKPEYESWWITEHEPWWKPEYWFRRSIDDDSLMVDEDTDEPLSPPPIQVVHWLESWTGQAQSNALGRAAWLVSLVPKRFPSPSTTFTNADFYQNAIYASELTRDIDGHYVGELPYITYQAARGKLDDELAKLQSAQGEFEAALTEQKDEVSTAEIKRLLSEPLRLNTSDFRQQIQAALADVRRAEAELDVAEHESLAAEFEVIANQMLTDAAGLEVEREKVHVQVKELDGQIREKESVIAKIDLDIVDDDVLLAENHVKVANLKIEQTKIRKQQAQAQLDAISLEIEFVRKILGAPEGAPPDVKQKYAIPIEIDGQPAVANGQIAAIALRTKDILSKQIDKQLSEAHVALAAAKKKERKAKKKAKRNKLIKSACKFIGSVVGAVYGGPAGAALGAQIGEAIAELTIGVMDNKPPMDILTGLVDNAFAIAGAAGYDLEAELNAFGSKAVGEISTYLDDFEAKIQPLLAEMPNVVNEELVQGALDVLGLEELNDVPALSKNLYDGLKGDLNNLGNIGTILKGAAGFETASQLQEHLKKNLVQKTDLAHKELAALGKRVGEQVDDLLTNPATQQEALDRVMAKVSPLVMGAIATQAGEFRQTILKDWIADKRGGDTPKFWNEPTVQEEARELLAHLFPESEEARTAAAVNLSEALLPPELYRGKIKEHLGPYQTKLDGLIDDILSFTPPSAKKESDFWQQQINHLNKAKQAFDERLFPFMDGQSVDNEPHPRDELLKKLTALEAEARNKLGDIKVLAIQVDINALGVDDAQIMLGQAEEELKKAEEFVDIAELNVQKESLLMQIAEISLKKAGTLEEAQKQAEQAAKERAAAGKAKIKAAKAELNAKEALLNGARRRGMEAGRIRSALDRPLAVLDLAEAKAQRARFEYNDAFQNAMIEYRKLVRYSLATFFVEDNGPGGLSLPKFIRPDLLELADPNIATWHEALDKWLQALDDSVLKAREAGQIGIEREVFHWDLTLEQIAAITSPSGLMLQVGPQVSLEETLLEVPSALVKEGPLSEVALGFFRENGFTLSSEAEFVFIGSPTSNLWRVFDDAKRIDDSGDEEIYVGSEVSIALHKKDGTPLSSVNVPADKDPKAYFLTEQGSDELLYLKLWPDHRRGDKQGQITGRSLRPRMHIKGIDSDHARNGRIVALFLGARDNADQPLSVTSDYELQAIFAGGHWIQPNRAQLQGPHELDSIRIIDWPTLDTKENADLIKPLELIKQWRDAKQDIDGDMDLNSVQGTPVAGTTKLRLSFTNALSFGRTVGAVSIVVLYKHYEFQDGSVAVVPIPVGGGNPVV